MGGLLKKTWAVTHGDFRLITNAHGFATAPGQSTSAARASASCEGSTNVDANSDSLFSASVNCSDTTSWLARIRANTPSNSMSSEVDGKKEAYDTSDTGDMTARGGCNDWLRRAMEERLRAHTGNCRGVVADALAGESATEPGDAEDDGDVAVVTRDCTGDEKTLSACCASWASASSSSLSLKAATPSTRPPRPVPSEDRTAWALTFMSESANNSGEGEGTAWVPSERAEVPHSAWASTAATAGMERALVKEDRARASSARPGDIADGGGR